MLCGGGGDGVESDGAHAPQGRGSPLRKRENFCVRDGEWREEGGE